MFAFLDVIDVDVDVNVVTFVVYLAEEDNGGGGGGCNNNSCSVLGEDVADQLNDLIHTNNAVVEGWLATDAEYRAVDVDAEDDGWENVVYIDEEERGLGDVADRWGSDVAPRRLSRFGWRDDQADAWLWRIVIVILSRDSQGCRGWGLCGGLPPTGGASSPTQAQLTRDSGLLEFNNVRQVNISVLP